MKIKAIAISRNILMTPSIIIKNKYIYIYRTALLLQRLFQTHVSSSELRPKNTRLHVLVRHPTCTQFCKRPWVWYGSQVHLRPRMVGDCMSLVPRFNSSLDSKTARFQRSTIMITTIIMNYNIEMSILKSEQKIKSAKNQIMK